MLKPSSGMGMRRSSFIITRWLFEHVGLSYWSAGVWTTSIPLPGT
jgi:hypothetical protein